MRDPKSRRCSNLSSEHRTISIASSPPKDWRASGHDPDRPQDAIRNGKESQCSQCPRFRARRGRPGHYFDDLAKALDSRQAFQAEAYIYELGKFEGKLPELHRYLKSNNTRVRAQMARIVGDIGDPSSRPLIEELTKDKDSEVVGGSHRRTAKTDTGLKG